MRIVHFLRRISIENWGGIEECVMNLAKQAEQLGHEVVILSTMALSSKHLDQIEGIKVIRLQYFYPYMFLSAKRREQLDFKGGNPIILGLKKVLESI